MGKDTRQPLLGESNSRPLLDPRRQSRTSQIAESMNQQIGVSTLTPYAVLKMAKDPRSAGNNPELRWIVEQDLRDGWTINRIAGMTTHAIEAQLAACGVNHSPARFLRLAEGRTSAWSVAEVWFANDRITCRGKEEDFIGLAACELWKRYLPDRPSIEMIDDWIQEGYVLIERQKNAEACDLWWKVWRTLHPRFLPAMTTMNSTRPVFSGLQSVFNWSQDLKNELGNASLRDRRYAAIGRQYCSEWIAQFRDEGDLQQVNFGRAFASFLHQAGDSEKAGVVLHELVEKWPDNVWGYVALADAYSHLFHHERIFPLDLEKAETHLRRGLALANIDDRDRELFEERLATLREQRAPEPRETRE